MGGEEQTKAFVNETLIKATYGGDLLKYKDKIVYNPNTGEPIKQSEFNELIETMEAFLNRNANEAGKKTVIDDAAKERLLRRMADSEAAAKEAEELEKDPFRDSIFLNHFGIELCKEEGVFNPRDTKTYKYARNIPLIIDGVNIYNIYDDGKKKIKEVVTESSFLVVLTTLLEIHAYTFDSPEVRQEYIDDYVDRYVYESKDGEYVARYGGYKFSLAQIEVVKGLSKKKLAIIGKIMVKGKQEEKEIYKIKQDLFYSEVINWDSQIFVALDSAKGFSSIEKRIMRDFYAECDNFESKEEMMEYFDKSEYLKKYPQLEKEVVENGKRLFDRRDE